MPHAKAELLIKSTMPVLISLCPKGEVVALSVNLAQCWFSPNQEVRHIRVVLHTAAWDKVLKHCPIAPLNIPQQPFNLRTSLYRLPGAGPRLYTPWCMYMRCEIRKIQAGCRAGARWFSGTFGTCSLRRDGAEAVSSQPDTSEGHA